MSCRNLSTSKAISIDMICADDSHSDANFAVLFDSCNTNDEKKDDSNTQMMNQNTAVRSLNEINGSTA